MPHSFLAKTSQALGALLLAWTCTQALAQSDLPGRVARLGHVDGSVSFAPAGSGDWGPAEFNRPLTSGDQLQTTPGARAELHSGSTALRLGEQTALEISELDDTTTRLTLTQGTLALRVRQLYPGEQMEINTPNLALTVSQPGEYRLDVDAGYRTTAVTVRSGSALVYGENGAVRTLNAPQQVRFADRQLAQEIAHNNPPRDAFDLWTSARDRSEDQSTSARFVSRDVIGYQQLDGHGDWRTSSEYGAVWFPRVSSSQWAPYRHGQWRWVTPWGWTWVDDAPWGFAPFHYGRWAQIGAQWAWVPGPIAQRPSFAPALVGFPGADRDNVWQDRRRPPSSGWFPLAPGDAWRPGQRNTPPRPSLGERDALRNIPPMGQGQAPSPFGFQHRPGMRMDGTPPPLFNPHRPRLDAPPLPAPRDLGDLQQRAQMQRQQQADRERMQQEQNRNQFQAQQAQREQIQQRQQQEHMRDMQERQQQMQREQRQRDQMQREQMQRNVPPQQPGMPQDRPRPEQGQPRPQLQQPPGQDTRQQQPPDQRRRWQRTEDTGK